MRPYAKLMPQSIVFIYQNVCKKVRSSILQYSYVIFSLWLVASSIFHLIPFNSITYATLTYSPCVPYADTISYKFHLVIFLKTFLILSANSSFPPPLFFSLSISISRSCYFACALHRYYSFIPIFPIS